MNTLTQITPLYAAVLLGVAALWLWQVAQAARRALWPRLGLLMPLGLGALAAAPVLEVPALFGTGVGFVLIAAYWPVMRLRSVPHRAGKLWSWVVLGLALALVVLAVQAQSLNSLLLSSVAVLYSLAGLLSGLLYPRRAPARSAGVPNVFLRRLQVPVTPATPDLELSLDVDAARLTNTSGRTLHLAGWSPASGNAWLRTRDAAGQPLAVLNAGETVYLTPWQPLPGAAQEGVRLWYAREGDDVTYLFRADWANTWVPGEKSEWGERVLN
ncbi:hypothetical protein [Deinococcus sp.]|uniref:hypothetical protein n=1 Tax=Deinococcus sp. TaxID=47478 RepID=UPI003B5B4314